MSSRIAGNREIQDNESNSEFVCLQQDLPINPNKGFVKMDISIKNKVINKLNEFTQALFDESLSNKQKIALLKENNEMVSTLNNLPVLVDSKEANYFVDCETNDAHSDVFTLDGGDDTRSNGQTHVDKFLKQLDMLLNKVGKFDAKQDGIRSWFAKYELCSRMLGWTDEQRVDSLSFFLDSGLFRVVQFEKMTSFNEIKDRLFKFVDDLLYDRSSLECQLKFMIRNLDLFKFSKAEKRYWVNCCCPEEKIIEYYENLKDVYSNKSIHQSSKLFYRDNLAILFT